MTKRRGTKAVTTPLRVVMFTGGRGSTALARQLGGDPEIDLTLIINGYDDGLSTGEVRRFLGDCLGPSDFRKNASRLAEIRRSAEQALIDLMDLRFPDEVDKQTLAATAEILKAHEPAHKDEFSNRVTEIAAELRPETLELTGSYYNEFNDYINASDDTFDFNDCSIGNLVFAGCFLKADRQFNPAVDLYCDLLGLERDVVVNVTNGENAFLVAIDSKGAFLPGETEIVDDATPNRIRDFYLIDQPGYGIKDTDTQTIEQRLKSTSMRLTLNDAAARAVEKADLILYAPGTQFSSLYPSYVTPGLGQRIAANTKALKLLVTNLKEDAETRDASALQIIEQALFYLREKGRHGIPAPCLVTHYLVNVPASMSNDRIPVGHMDSLEDPRLIRIGNYEDGISGRHHADRILAPFIQSLKKSREPSRVGVVLMDNNSSDKALQTMLEIVRAGAGRLAQNITVYLPRGAYIPETDTSALPFAVRAVDSGYSANRSMIEAALNDEQDYLCLFETSGMYHGHDVVALISNLNQEHLDAAWGSRRLSSEDVMASYRFRYQSHLLEGFASYVGSHLLSLACLLMYGRYISDTLSGIRLVRSEFLKPRLEDLDDPCFNQRLLADLLKARGKVFELPVDFIPISPDKVKRTTITEGLQSLWVIIKSRFLS